MIGKRKYLESLIVFIMVSFIVGCLGAMSKPLEKENRLKYRVAKYHEDMKAGDYESNWDMFPTEDIMKRPDKDKFLMQTRTVPKLIDYRIEKIEINENKAMIKKYVEFKIGEEVVKELYYDYWMYQNNEWYIMDGFRTKPSGPWDQEARP